MSSIIIMIRKKYKKYTNKIIILQKFIRRYLIQNNILIPSSYYQTKIWRKNRKWYNNGKSNECEKYQINLIEKISLTKLIKTDVRINIDTYEMISIRYPMKNIDGYEWSENFDGLIEKNKIKYYFNLKFVCDRGGSQTRTLKLVYDFIRCQLEYLVKNIKSTSNIYFINILDGDECYKNNNKFIYLINKIKYKHIKQYIFCGSLRDFQQKKYYK